MVASYPAARAVVTSPYTMLGGRYEEPAVTVDPRVS